MAGEARASYHGTGGLAEALPGSVVHELPTLFDDNGSLNQTGFTQHARQVAGPGDFLIVNSDMGEGLSLSPPERRRVVELAVAADAAPVIVDVTSFSTVDSLELAAQAQQAGAAAISVARPHYWHLGDRELAGYFRQVARSVSLPVLLATGSTRASAMLPALIGQVAQRSRNIIGAIFRGNEYIPAIEAARRVRSQARPFGLILAPPLRNALACDPSAALLTSAASVAPELVRQAGSAFRQGNVAGNRSLLFRLIELERLIRSDPARLKLAANSTGGFLGTPRLPLQVPLLAERSMLYEELARLEMELAPLTY